MFDLADARGVLMELEACRKIYGDRYIRLSAFNSSHGWESVRISFIVNRPKPRTASASSGAEGPAGRSITRPAPTRPTGPKESATHERDSRGRRRDRSGSISPTNSRGRASARCFKQLDDELVGLAPVKSRIREIAALLLVDRVRSKFGLTSQAPTLHMSFTGNPGTGKTTVALRMAEILHRLGYVRRGHLVAVTRDDLVGQYIGHTAPKTKEVLKKAMGGVLFIDEAYYLYRQENERDYGQESIEILLQVMENNRDDLVVILAGYADKMDRFFHSNPGFRSRVAHHIDFPDYDDADLLAIGEKMLSSLNYRLSAEAERALADYVALRRTQPLFANARSIRNALDRARLRQANRLFAAGDRGSGSRPADCDRSRRHSPEPGVPAGGEEPLTMPVPKRARKRR